MNKIKKQLILVHIFVPLVLLGLYYAIWGFTWNVTDKNLLLFFIWYILGITLHELLHGAGFILFGRARFSEVKLGILWKQLAPYAHCKIPLSIRAYKISILLPVILTGILPFIIGLAIGNLLTVVVATFLIVGGYGDWLMYQKIKHFPSHANVLDHPSDIGCIVYIQQ